MIILLVVTFLAGIGCFEYMRRRYDRVAGELYRTQCNLEDSDNRAIQRIDELSVQLQDVTRDRDDLKSNLDTACKALDNSVRAHQKSIVLQLPDSNPRDDPQFLHRSIADLKKRHTARIAAYDRRQLRLIDAAKLHRGVLLRVESQKSEAIRTLTEKLKQASKCVMCGYANEPVIKPLAIKKKAAAKKRVMVKKKNG